MALASESDYGGVTNSSRVERVCPMADTSAFQQNKLHANQVEISICLRRSVNK